MREKQINLDQVLARAIKGYAFMRYPNAVGDLTAADYRERHKKELAADRDRLTETEFRLKYEAYIY